MAQDRYYIKWGGNNFGDNLNDIIFEHLGSKNCLLYKKNLQIPDNCYLGLGSIIGKRINRPVTVLGSGMGNGLPKSKLNFGFVRGKITCETLGIDYSYALGDTAYFLKDYMQNIASPIKKFKFGIIPHHKTHMQDETMNIISPELPVNEFIKKVSECEYVLCEAMHGAICADILRVPFAPVKIGNNFYETKWRDWASVLEIDLTFGDLSNYQLVLSDDKKMHHTHLNIKNYLDNEFKEK